MGSPEEPLWGLVVMLHPSFPTAPRPPPTWWTRLLLHAVLGLLCLHVGAPGLHSWQRGAGEGLPGHPQGAQQVVLQVHAHARQPLFQL